MVNGESPRMHAFAAETAILTLLDHQPGTRVWKSRQVEHLFCFQDTRIKRGKGPIYKDKRKDHTLVAAFSLCYTSPDVFLLGKYGDFHTLFTFHLYFKYLTFYT